jgi:hypothetical protein
MGGNVGPLGGHDKSAGRTSFALWVLLGPSIAVAVALAAVSLSKDAGQIRTGDFPGLPNVAPTPAQATPAATNATAGPRDPSQAPAGATQPPVATSPRAATNTPSPTLRPDDSTPRPTAAPTVAPTSTPLPTVVPTSTPVLPSLLPTPLPTVPPLVAPVRLPSPSLGLP